MEKILKSPIELVDLKNFNSDERLICEVPYEMLDDYRVWLVSNSTHLLVVVRFWNTFKKSWGYNQSEFPLAFITWLVDRIENGFWRGNISSDQLSIHVEIDGEKVGVNAEMHCCAENMFGYAVWNASRSDHLVDIPPQTWHIPRIILEQGLIDRLKSL